MMSEEKQPSKAQLFFTEHGEKIALGVAGGLVIVYLVLFLGSSGGNPDVEAVNTSAQKIQEESTQLHPVGDPRRAPDFPKSSEKSNEFLETWATPAASPAFPAGDWSTSLRTQGTPEGIPHITVQRKPWELASVKFDTIQATAQGITLTWSTISPEDPEEKNVAEIDHFIVERRDPDGTKKKLGEAGSDQLTLLDEDVKKKTNYQYRVTPVTKDPQYIAATYSGKGAGTGWKTGTSIDIWKISFSNPSPSEGKVYITIEKEDKKFGKVTVKHFQEVGDKIGWWKEKKTVIERDEFGRETKKETNDLTADHVVRGREVNFDTARTISAIETRQYKITREECRVENGICTLVVKVMIPQYPIKVVVYQDEEGKEHVWKMKDPANHNQAKARYSCDQHRSAPPK